MRLANNRRHRLLLASGLALATLAAGVAGCTSNPSSTGGAPSMASIRTLLARHAMSVLDHSVAGFLADVDASPASHAFRTRQAAEIANLAQVPLRSWAYQVEAPVTDAPALAASSRRYGSPSVMIQVSLVYALRYVDLRATSHDLWLTFVRRGGRTYLAGDDDLVNEGSSSWVGPWDFGPLAVARGRASLVLGPVEDAARLPALAAAVDAAIPVVTSVWGTGWSHLVAVVVAASAAEFATVSGQHGSVADDAAIAVTDGQDPLSGQSYGQRLVLNPNALDALTTVGRRIVLQHEITHLATANATADTTPRWLVEGFAEYVANMGSGQPVRVAASELAAAVRRGELPNALPADSAFESGAAAARAYEQSWLACRLIALRFGQAALVGFYRSVGTADDPPEDAVAAAMRGVLHESLAGFTALWRRYLQTQLS